MKRASWYWFVLGIAGIAIYGYFDPARVPFPPCPLRVITGWLCPGCGSQRAIHQLIHGNFGSAFRLNLLFLPGMIYATIGYFISGFLPGSWLSVRDKYYGIKAAYISLIVILVFWVGRNLI